MSPSPAFQIRLCTEGDIPALERLIPLSVRALHAEVYTPAQISGALGTVFGVDSQLIRDGTYFVAEVVGTIVGCGGWSRRRTLFGSDQGKTEPDLPLDPLSEPARIRAFFVHPDWARRGIGRRIMEAAESAAIAAGFKRIDIVATLVGEPLYRSFGYGVMERYEVLLPNGARLPVVRLSNVI